MSDTLDTRFMSRDFLTTFIHIYKQHPALWRIKSKEYANKNLKLKGYQALIQYCRSVYPSANRDFVTKKIQNMRGTFRKELRKIENYRKRRELYEPRLWYFDLLSFIKDQEFTDKSVECAGNASGEENSDGEKIEIVRQGSEDENAGVSDYSIPPAFMKSICVRKKQRRQTQALLKSRKRRASEQQNELLKLCVAALSRKDTIDEYTAVSVNIAAKLKKMDPVQRTLAEGLINKVLHMGLFKELRKTTDVLDEISKSY